MTFNSVSDWDTKFAKSPYAWGLEPSYVARRLRSFVGPACRALDIACGCGRDALHFAVLGATAIGIDWSEEGIRQARQLEARDDITGDLTYRVADMRRVLDH